MKKGVPIRYIIKNMYDVVVANVRTCDDLTSDFLIKIGLHQEFMLSPFLFRTVMYEFARAIIDEMS